ncbi:MAG: acetyl-CoA C-acyltransferase, partial [Acidobacteria bacterium]|nr:acetyl-CoA C-acyltransferase [Acidobacteriota bacterium]
MEEAYICDAVRTPFGKYAGALSSTRADDLAAIPIRALIERHPGLDWGAIDDVIYGCTNQAGEDNRNVARMALLLAGLPKEVPGTTVNRLCGSSLEAVAQAARSIKCGEASLVIAGGVESMSRAPFVMGKAESPFSRMLKVEDTTIGWRLINPRMKEKYGTDSMPETAENVAEEWNVSREDQDKFAFRSQRRTAEAVEAGRLAEEIVPVTVDAKKGSPAVVVSRDEQPRPETTVEALAKLKPIVKANGTVTAGNSSGVNDGACALVVASAKAVSSHALQPVARIIAAAATGVLPRVMGMGPVPAVKKVLALSGLKLSS